MTIHESHAAAKVALITAMNDAQCQSFSEVALWREITDSAVTLARQEPVSDADLPEHVSKYLRIVEKLKMFGKTKTTVVV